MTSSKSLKSKSKIDRQRAFSDDTTDDLEETTKPDVVCITDSEAVSRDELEDAHKSQLQPSNVSPKQAPVSIPRQTRDATHSLRDSLPYHADSMTTKTNTSKATSFVELLLASSKAKSTQNVQMERLSKKTHLSMQDASMSLDDVKPSTSTDRQISVSDGAHQVISVSDDAHQVVLVEELNDFDVFSDTGTESDDRLVQSKSFLPSTNIEDGRESVDTLLEQQKRQSSKYRFLSKDIESASDSKETYRSSKKDDSIEKVSKWLDSRTESSSCTPDVMHSVAKPDCRTDETSIHHDLVGLTEPTSIHPPPAEIVCDTFGDDSHIKTQLEPVMATLTRPTEQGGTKSKNVRKMSRSVSVDSTSSTSSSLPPVMWKQDIQHKEHSAEQNAENEHREAPDVTYHQLQPSLISTTSDQYQALPTQLRDSRSTASKNEAEDVTERPVHDPSILEDEYGKTKSGQNEEDFDQLDVHDIAEDKTESRHHHSKGKGVASTLSLTSSPHNRAKKLKLKKKLSLNIDHARVKQKPILESSEPKSACPESPEEIVMYPLEDLPVAEEDIAPFEQVCHQEHKTPKVSTATETSHCVSNSSNLERASPTGSEHQERSKYPTKRAKSDGKGVTENRGKVTLTEVSGMTYSTRKAALKSSMDAQLPSPSTSLLRPPPRTQLSVTPNHSTNSSDPTTFSLPSFKTRMNVQLPTPSTSALKPSPRTPSSTLKPTPRMQSSNTSVNSGSYKGKGPNTLSLPTKKLLDSIGQSPMVTADANQPLRPHQPQSYIPAHGPKKYIPLKPRILPKVDDFLVEVLSWEPAAFLYPQQTEDGKLLEPMIQLKEGPFKVPMIFESYDHYLRTFTPLVFLELWKEVSHSL